jgi:lipopolysaccharide transport system permease protein
MMQMEDTPISPPQGRCPDPAVGRAFASGNEDGPDPAETVIHPQSGWIGINWRELIASRELLVYLVWRDISVRYKQTILGPAWAILQPLILMLIFTVIFGWFARFDSKEFSEGFAYPVFVFAGLIPWTLFSQGMPQSALSLINQQHLLTKVYFPRLYIPIAAACVFLVDLVFSLGIYGLLLLYYRVVPSWTVVFLPFLVLLTLITTLSIGVTISALTVFYRDFRHIVPFLTQILMYTTPVIYSAKVVSQRYQLFLALNPMWGIVSACRSAILGLEWNFPTLAISTASALGSFVFAVLYFRRTERRFADFA